VWLVGSVAGLTVHSGFAACLVVDPDSDVKLLSDPVGYCFASFPSCWASRCCSRPPASCLFLCYPTIFFCGCFVSVLFLFQEEADGWWLLRLGLFVRLDSVVCYARKS
jgi:hypothetical protein